MKTRKVPGRMYLPFDWTLFVWLWPLDGEHWFGAGVRCRLQTRALDLFRRTLFVRRPLPLQRPAPAASRDGCLWQRGLTGWGFYDLGVGDVHFLDSDDVAWGLFAAARLHLLLVLVVELVLVLDLDFCLKLQENQDIESKVHSGKGFDTQLFSGWRIFTCAGTIDT